MEGALGFIHCILRQLVEVWLDWTDVPESVESLLWSEWGTSTNAFLIDV
jgi:hypothetical protein